MKTIKLIAILAMLTAFAFGQFPLPVTSAPPNQLNQNAAVGPAGALSSPSALLVNVTGGPVVCQGMVNYLAATQFNVAASTTYNVGVTCGNEGVWVRPACSSSSLSATQPGATPCTNIPTAPNEILLGTAVAGATTITSTTDARSVLNFPLVTDGYRFIQPSPCWMTAGTTAFTAGPALVRAAAGNLVLSGTTNTTAGTVTVDCEIPVDTKITSGKGAVVNDITLFYGVQTTALSSIAALAPTSVTYPAAGGSAAGTVAAIGGSLTVTPGSLQTATTTSGQCYDEKVAFGTPFAYTADNTRITLEQVFTTAGSTATVLQICGVGIHYTTPII